MSDNILQSSQINDDDIKLSNKTISDAQVTLALHIQKKLANALKTNVAQNYSYAKDAIRILIKAARKNRESNEAINLLNTLSKRPVISNIETFYASIMDNQVEDIPDELKKDLAEQVKHNTFVKIENIYQYSDAMSGTAISIQGWASEMIRKLDKAPETLFKLSYGHYFFGINSIANALARDPNNKETTLFAPLAGWDYSDKDGGDLSALNKTNYSRSKSAQDIMIKRKAIESRLDFYGKWNTRTFGFLNAAFTGVQGGIDVATGFENSNDIRKAQGVITCLSTVNMFAGNIAAELTSTTAKKITRFAPVVGSLLSASANFASVAKHAEQVVINQDAGNNSRAAGYAVITALNAISGVLDFASGVSELFLPPPLNIVVGGILDITSLVVSLGAELVSFFVDTFDSRSDQVKLDDRFENYVNSKAFKAYLDTVAKDLEAQDYDRFELHLDAAGIGMIEGEAKSQTSKNRTIISELRKTKRGAIESLWRIAILDYSTEDKDHHGRQANDLIRLLSKTGHPGLKNLYGEDGDDILEAGLGNTIMYGGNGNDKLIVKSGDFISHAYGEKGNDVIAPYRLPGFGSVAMYGPYNGVAHGGEGDDIIAFNPAGTQSGGEGVDTLEVGSLNNFTHGALLCKMFETYKVNQNYEDPCRIVIERGDLGSPSLTKYVMDDFENLTVNEASDHALMMIATSGAVARRIAVNWSESDAVITPVIVGVYALGCDSIISLKNIPPLSDIRIYGTGSDRKKIYRSYNQKTLDQFSEARIRDNIKNNISRHFKDILYNDNLDQKYSTTLHVVRSMRTGDVNFIDNNRLSFYKETGRYDNLSPRYVQCSGIRHFIIDNQANDEVVTIYDFSRKKEVLPHSTITIRDSHAHVIGGKGICCYHIELSNSIHSQWKIIGSDKQYNNTLDLSVTTGDFIIDYQNLDEASVRLSSAENTSVSTIQNIHCLRLNKSACTITGRASGLTIFSNGGMHTLNGGSSSNEFIINGGVCNVTGGTTDDTYYISPLMNSTTTINPPSASLARIKTTTVGNTLIIDNIQGFNDIIVTETVEGLNFATTINGVFLTDLTWGTEKKNTAISLETRLANLAKRFSNVLLPNSFRLKSYSGHTLAEYVKDRISGNGLINNKIVSLNWFTPLKLSSGSNTLVIDKIESSWLTSMPASTVNDCFDIKSIFPDQPTSDNMVFSGFEYTNYPERVKYIKFGFNALGKECYSFKYNNKIVHYISLSLGTNSFGAEQTKIVSIIDVSIKDVVISSWVFNNGYQLSRHGKVFLIIDYIPTVLHFGADNLVIVGKDQVKNFLDKKAYHSYGMSQQSTLFKEIQVGTHGIKSVDIEFPKTAMMNATFKLIPYDTGMTYTWSSSESWVQVHEGVVKFINKPLHNRFVTITAKPTDISKPDITYQFRTHHWYDLAIANGENLKELETRFSPLWVIDGPYQGLLNESLEHPGLLAEWKDLTPDILIPGSNHLNFCLLDSDVGIKQVINWSTTSDSGSSITAQSTDGFINWSSRTTIGERWLIGKNLGSYDYIYSFNSNDTTPACSGELLSEYTYQNDVHYLKTPLSGENYHWGVTDVWLDVTAAGRVIFKSRKPANTAATVYARQRRTPVPPLTFSITAGKVLGIGNIRIATPQQAQKVLSLEPDLDGHQWNIRNIGDQDLLFIPLAVPASGIGKLSVATSEQRDHLKDDPGEYLRNSYQCIIPKC